MPLMSAALMLRAGAVGLTRAGALSLCLRPRATGLLLLKAPRRQHAASLAATSVTVRAVAAEQQQAAAPPATFTQLGVSQELQVRALGGVPTAAAGQAVVRPGCATTDSTAASQPAASF